MQVIDSAPRINVDHLPVERQVTHLIDFARVLILVAKDDEALQTLFTAERTSPGIVWDSVVVRESCGRCTVGLRRPRARSPRCYWRWSNVVER